jgi:membrane-bound serine protease (ClpP class)
MRKESVGRWIIGMVAMLGLVAGAHNARAQSGGEAVVLTLDGPLTPVFHTYVERGLNRAERDDAEVVILQLNTPGGRSDFLETLVAELRSSEVPIVVYVTPRGAMAASAGTVITLAGHAAAMAPETTIGAASPIGATGENLDSTAEAKAKEIFKAMVRTLAARRGEAAIAFAESTIESAKAATESEALEVGLIDFVATDVADLLRQLDGFSVEVDGVPRTLATRGLTLVELPMNALETLLKLLADANVVSILISLGSLLIWVEVSQPGGWVAGFVGAVCLVLAFYGLGVLPVNWFGIIFIVIAFILFIMETQAPTHGGLTTAGAASLIVGMLVLFNSPGTPSFFRVNVPLVVVTSLALAGSVFALMLVALRAQRAPLAMGVQTLIGQEGEVRAPNAVQVAGELWTAEAMDGALEPGQRVEVAEVKGLKLLVRKKKS